MAHLPDGLGPRLCRGTTRAGTPCFTREAGDLGYCLHHVDDDLLPLAEQIMGFRRCRKCRQFAVKGSVLCKNHGCNRGSAQRRNADLNATAMEIIEQTLGLRTYIRKRGVPVKATWRDR